MKLFFRNAWRKKDKSEVSCAVQHEKQDLVLARVQSSHQIQVVVVPPPTSVASKTQDEKTLRRRSKSVGTLGKHGPPANVRHGPPMNSAHGPPMTSSVHRPPPLSSSSASTLPRRPPRPQPLYTSESNLGEWSSISGDPQRATSLNHVSLDIPPLPSRPTSRDGRSSRTTRKEKRTVPEIEGSWRQFLTDVQEDINTLDFSSDAPIHLPPALRTKQENGSSIPLTAPLKTTKQSPSLSSKATARPALIQTSHSAPAIITGVASTANGAEFSLSLFPTPPPLGLRKRSPPRPLDLSSTYARSETSLPEMSPGYSCSTPDLTPIPTPTTPRFSQQQKPYISRTPKTYLSPTSSVDPTPPSSPSRPSTPTSAHEELYRKELRNTRSFSHLRNLAYSATHKHPAFHRNSSSDTSSDHSIPSLTADDKPRDAVPHVDLHCLTSCGRVYSQHSMSQARPKMQPGIAL